MRSPTDRFLQKYYYEETKALVPSGRGPAIFLLGTSKAETAFVVKMEGDFDISERDRLRNAFAIVMGACFVALDLSAVDYLDSWTLQNIVALAQITRDGNGKFVMFGLNPTVHRILETCSLKSYFDIRARRSDLDEMLDGAHVRTLRLIVRYDR